MKSTSPESFEHDIHAAIERKRAVLESISNQVHQFEKTILDFATSPTAEGLEYAVAAAIERDARKSLLDLSSDTFTPDTEFSRLANSGEGQSVLLGLHAEKRQIVAAMKAKIRPARDAAAAAESTNEDEFFRLTEEADALAANVSMFENVLSATATQIPRMSSNAQGEVTYKSVRDQLFEIIP